MSHDYVANLAALPPGDAQQGEIRLVADPEARSRAEFARRERLRAAELPEDWARTGEVFRDEFVAVYRDAVEFPSGSVGTYLRITPADSPIRPLGVQAVVWVDGSYLLLHNFRHATRRWEWAFPRGFVPAGEQGARHVLVELLEELGPVRVVNSRLLGIAAPDSGLLATEVEHWLVELEDLPQAVGAAAEPQEAIGGYKRLTPAQFWTQICGAESLDGITITGFALSEAARRSASPSPR